MNPVRILEIGRIEILVKESDPLEHGSMDGEQVPVMASGPDDWHAPPCLDLEWPPMISHSWSEFNRR